MISGIKNNIIEESSAMEIAFFEIVELSGFIIPLLPEVIIITIVGTIPFLFFKKTRCWKTIISILFIVAGWVYGKIMVGNYFLNFYKMNVKMNISNPEIFAEIFAYGIFFLYLVTFAITPIAIFKINKKNKWRHFLWLIPLLLVYIGLEINQIFWDVLMS